MQPRRVILLIAVILGVTAVAASLAPAPHSTQRPATAPPPQTGGSTVAPPPAPAAPPTIAFAAQAAKRPPVKTVKAGEHVVVEVGAATTGEAAIPALGLSGSAEPGTPATFDVIVPAGRATVTFTPTLGAAQTVGTLVGTS
jgi:hypothetical protein